MKNIIRKAYPKYKPSGVEWLGDVPEHWEVKKFGSCAIFQEGPGLRNWQFADEGVRVICVTNITEKGIDFSNYSKFISEKEYYNSYKHFTVQNGDLLLSSSGNSWGKLSKYESDEVAVLNTSTIRIIKDQKKKLSDNFTKWLIKSDSSLQQLGLFMTGSCQPNFGPTHLSKVINPVPPLPEQQTIAAFLDRETGRIDALIAKKERLLELLAEQRTALISRAVTKGLNASVKMKPSGVEWLGDVPEHWEIWKLAHLTTRIGSGKTPTGGADVYQAEGVLFLRSQNVYDDGLYLEDVVYIDEKIDEEMAWSRVKPKDILLNITGASLGRTCLTPTELGKANVNQHVCVIRLNKREYADFLAQYLKSRPAKSFYDFVQTGSAREGLNFEQIGAFPVPLPPLLEQQAIAAFLDRETAKIDALSAKVTTVIERLKEYRTALISSAVTGKIDVRGSL